MAINTSSLYGTDAQQSMRDKVMAKIVDTVSTHNPLLAIALSNKDNFTGKQYRVPFRYQDTNQGGSFAGLDTFSRNKVDTRVSALFDAKFYQQSVVIEGTELSMANNADAMINYELSKVEESAIEMSQDVGDIMHGDGTGNSSKNFDGLINGSGDATSAASYGGLARATYTTWLGTVDRTAYNSTTTYALSNLDTSIDAASQGNNRPDLILCSPEVFTIIKALMPTPSLNYDITTNTTIDMGAGRRPALTAYAGYERIEYRGIPVVKDDMMASGKSAAEDYLFVLNTSTWKFPTLPAADAMKFIMSSSQFADSVDSMGGMTSMDGFYMTPWRPSWDQFGKAADIFLFGNLICTNPRLNAHATQING